jgi:toxin ParE1/3/4
MKKPVIVREEAEADLSEAYQWYEQQVRGLGGEFLLCVDGVMTSIEKNPHLYPVVHKGVIRRALTRRFPYGVFFKGQVWNDFLSPKPAMTVGEINQIVAPMNFQIPVDWEPMKKQIT